MRTHRWMTGLSAVGLALVFAASVWFRVSSLDAIPWHNGDESYEGIELVRMLQGQRFTIFTTNGNLMSPFFLGLQLPFQWSTKPALWVLRVPAVISGILAIVLAYAIGRKALDRPTALLASAALAATPAAVVYSRIGHEYSQIPIVGVLALCFAFQARPVGLGVTLAAGLLAHPINLFVFPAVLPVFAVQLARKYRAELAGRARTLAAASAALAVGGGVLAYVIAQRPIVQRTLHTRPPLDWPTFGDGLARFLLYDYQSPAPAVASHQRLLAAVLVALLAVGVPRLVLGRRWERLALLFGLATSLAAFHVIAGPRMIFVEGSSRYGVVFLAPAAFAFAALLQAAVGGGSKAVAETGTPPTPASWVPRGVVAALGGGMLYAMLGGFFAPYSAPGRESIWTFKADVREPLAEVYTLIIRDYLRNGIAHGTCRIAGETFWISKPLEFLGSRRRLVRVEQLDEPEVVFPTVPPPATTEEAQWRQVVKVVDRLRRGSYVVANLNPKDSVTNRAIRNAFPPGRVRSWTVPNPKGNPCYGIYRLEPAEVAATREDSIVR